MEDFSIDLEGNSVDRRPRLAETDRINSRPERKDPPRDLLKLAVDGCRFSIDTDAHAPGQLDWQ